ncbi:MAG TPA: FprA family A-type flavoprotein, partial [Spirochaetia bacterium]|nr:FprA family A-type flavoprotein [Spirochaetia bacterium]
MKAVALSDGIYGLHANVQNNDLFEGIWPIPDGVSLNSYILKGDKVAMIDLFRDWDGAKGKVEAQLTDLGLSFRDIDYLIINHMEPDHTGWLAEFKKINPSVEILTTKKAAVLVKAFYHFDDGIRVVATGDTLSLGGGKELLFVETPNVHWPETMVTYEKQSKTLFSCDAFGSFGKVADGKEFDDLLTAAEHEFFEGETDRYYADIISSFSAFVLKALDAVKSLDIGTIAPSHGIIWRKDIARVIERYRRLASYFNTPAEKRITVVWASMYGNTEKMLPSILEGIRIEGVPVSIHRIPEEHVSYVLSSAWKSRGLVLGMPTYEYKMFPPMAYVLDILERSHVAYKKVLRFGSFGWSGGAQKEPNLSTFLYAT